MTTWTDIEAATVADILDWAEPQPWARAMAACGQDAGWHAEGDVWTHTKMVVGELERLAEWPTFEPESRLKLIFTALFHDAGKPATTITDPETGRVRSPKHAIVGMELGRAVLRDLGCGLPFREEVANLVRYHGRPPYLLEKTDPAREVIGLSWVVDHRLLYAFALADTRGRHAKEMTRAEDDLHLWKMVAEENACFDRPYSFANDHARFLFFRNELSSLHYTPREDYRCRATLVTGLPGTGKDTWLAANRPDLPVVSLDDIRADLDVEPTGNQGHVIQAAREMCREHLRAKQDFAFNATNTMLQTRTRWADLFAEYGARIEIVYLEPPLETIFRQNRGRERRVPQVVLDRLLGKLEPPTRTEAHAVELIG
ncbi:AAA family ATPase [Limnoglobus roseus]|uniref:HD domain-containing protein n=1 Tax=Limnoglobus roseus TaxID=2598579 RepID=A0A5C1A2P7_9BACT|nr:AAA family ATPase [Limnoglobus roseus]QEL13411.1 HD domain-containing protein [Limnoglobus roseus]